jgi:hypothetical protein
MGTVQKQNLPTAQWGIRTSVYHQPAALCGSFSVHFPDDQGIDPDQKAMTRKVSLL